MTTQNVYLSVLWVLSGGLVCAQTGVISTYAGNGSAGYSGDGGTATFAMLNGPGGLAVDSNGNLFIADTNNSRVRKISGGIITTVAGGGTGGDGGLATAAQLQNPCDVKVDYRSLGRTNPAHELKDDRLQTRATVTPCSYSNFGGFVCYYDWAHSGDGMNWKRLLITIVVVWLASHITGFVIHGVILANDYKALVDQKVYSSPEQFQSRAMFLILAYIAYAVGTVWMYAKGVDAQPWIGQGLRFGFAVWLVLAVPSFVVAYATQPIPGILTAKQLFWELLNKLVLGVLTAALYRTTSRHMENRIIAERAAFSR